jgi:predicted nucleotidyltransferase
LKPSAALQRNSQAIRRIVESHHAGNARVFGSVRHELGQLLGVPVDVLTPNALPDQFRADIIAQARPI